MEYLPPASVRSCARGTPAAAAAMFVLALIISATNREHPVAVVAGCMSLLALSWIAAATALTHLCGVRELVVRPPQNTADFHALSGLRVRVQLGNERKRWPALFVTAQLETKADGITLDSPPVFVVHLPAFGQLGFGWDITVRKRGEFDLLGVRVSTCFPGSVASHEARFPFAQRLLALPAIYRLDQRALQLLMGRRRSGSRTSSAPASLEEFVGVREYRPGDNPRSVHLALSIRLPDFPHQLAVREYEDPSNEDVSVILDSTVTDPSDALQCYRYEKALSFTVALCGLLVEKHYSVRFRTVDEAGARIDVPILRPTRDMHRLEAQLARLRPARDSAALERMLGDAGARGSDAVVLVSSREQSAHVSDGRAMIAVGPETQASLVREVVAA